MSEENPLLKKVQMPGKRFRLPSKGLFYIDDELSDTVIDGEVLVNSMTAIDEISLRSPEFLFSGEAIERVFKRCIPEVKKPLRLLSKDVDYLLTALRVVSYGNVLDIDLRCDKCQETQNTRNDKAEAEFIEEVRVKAEEQGIAFETALESEQVYQKLKSIRGKKAQKRSYHIDLNGVLVNQTREVSEEAAKKFSFTLSNGQKIQTTPLKMDSAVLSFQFQNEDLSKDLTRAEEYISFVMAACILSVTTEGENGELIKVTNPQHIAEWTTHLPIKLKDELTKNMATPDEWGTSFDYTLKCPDCGWEKNADTMLNPITFFIQPSDQEELSN